MLAELQEWNIQPRGHVCAVTGVEFVEGETVFSALYWDNGVYTRADYSAVGWNSRADGRQPLSVWQKEYEAPAPPPPEALKKDDAESLLRRLLQENNPAKANVIYILAVMLERKRILRLLDRKKNDGKVVLVYEHLPTGESWIVPDPELKLEQVPAVQSEVSALLAAEMGGLTSA
jgi:hypothetical protein